MASNILLFCYKLLSTSKIIKEIACIQQSRQKGIEEMGKLYFMYNRSVMRLRLLKHFFHTTHSTFKFYTIVTIIYFYIIKSNQSER